MSEQELTTALSGTGGSQEDVRDFLATLIVLAQVEEAAPIELVWDVRARDPSLTVANLRSVPLLFNLVELSTTKSSIGLVLPFPASLPAVIGQNALGKARRGIEKTLLEKEEFRCHEWTVRRGLRLLLSSGEESVQKMAHELILMSWVWMDAAAASDYRGMEVTLDVAEESGWIEGRTEAMIVRRVFRYAFTEVESGTSQAEFGQRVAGLLMEAFSDISSYATKGLRQDLENVINHHFLARTGPHGPLSRAFVKLWRPGGPGEHLIDGNAPLVAFGDLLVTLHMNKVIAWNVNSGLRMWSRQLLGPVTSAVVLPGTRTRRLPPLLLVVNRGACSLLTEEGSLTPLRLPSSVTQHGAGGIGGTSALMNLSVLAATQGLVMLSNEVPQSSRVLCYQRDADGVVEWVTGPGPRPQLPPIWREFLGHTDSAGFSPVAMVDESSMAFRHVDRTSVKLVPAEAMESLRLARGGLFHRHNAEVTAIAAAVHSNSRTLLFVAQTGGTIRVWDVKTHGYLHMFHRRDTAELRALVTFPRQARVVAYSPRSRSIVVWDYSEALDHVDDEPAGSREVIEALAVTPSGKVISGTHSSYIQWSRPEPEEPPRALFCLDVESPHGFRLMKFLDMGEGGERVLVAAENAPFEWEWKSINAEGQVEAPPETLLVRDGRLVAWDVLSESAVFNGERIVVKPGVEVPWKHSWRYAPRIVYLSERALGIAGDDGLLVVDRSNGEQLGSWKVESNGSLVVGAFANYGRDDPDDLVIIVYADGRVLGWRWQREEVYFRIFMRLRIRAAGYDSTTRILALGQGSSWHAYRIRGL